MHTETRAERELRRAREAFNWLIDNGSPDDLEPARAAVRDAERKVREEADGGIA